MSQDSDPQTSAIINRKTFAICCGLLLGIIFSFHNSNLGKYAEDKISHALLFRIRDRLDLSPPIHPKLKIYALDDYAVGKLQAQDIQLEDWGDIIAAISRSQPKAIIIDKKFGLIRKNQDTDSFNESLQKSAPVFIGGFTRKKRRHSSENSLLNLKKPQYILENYKMSPATNTEWIRIRNDNAFAADQQIADSFYRMGHINYEDVGRIVPLIRISEEHIFPHLTLLTADSFKINDKTIVIDGVELGLDENGLLQVDFPKVYADHENGLYRRTKSIFNLYHRKSTKLKKFTKKIRKGDTVVILPLFFTGNADMGQTPLGELPRGFVIVSVINSILNKRWLTPLNISHELISLGVLMGALLGTLLNPVNFWLASLGVCVLFFILANALFIFASLISPWFIYEVAFFASAVTFFSIKTIRQNRVAQAYEIALSGLVSHKSLKQLVKNPAAISRDASEQLLTIMFIDMVSFSNMAEAVHPRMVFSRLKEILGHFSEKVHAHGGVVDKTLGDGMLCFFGYNYIDGSTFKNHADQAIHCAEEIQIEHVKHCLEKAQQGETMIPLRIGINSAKVYIGDLGNKERIDFTLIGSGVNFAQRLESACDPFSILLSEETLNLSSKFVLNSEGIRTRQIKVKHHQELFNVIEYHPFHDKKELLEEAKSTFYGKKDGQHQYRPPRFSIENPKLIFLKTNFGEAELLNFSRTGYALKLEKPAELGELILFNLSSKDASTKKYLEESSLPEVHTEVRWASKEDSDNIYGVKITNLNETQKENVYDCLKEVMTRII